MLAATDTENMTAEEAYQLVRPTIEKTVWQFLRRYLAYEWRFDDLFANASLSFMRAYNERDKEFGWRGGHPNFCYAVRRWVWAELFDAYRVEKQHRRKRKLVRKPATAIDRIAVTDYSLANTLFLDSLGNDAKLVAKLVLETPAEIAAIVQGKGGEPRNWRSTLRSYLEGLGWGRQRINRSFAEIAAAL